jgi:hypothetical protein
LLHVNVLAFGGIVAVLFVASLNEFVDDDRSLESSVLADGFGRDFASFPNDFDADILVEVLGIKSVKLLGSIEECCTSSNNNAFV